MNWRIAEPKQVLGAARVALTAGGNFLTSRLAPDGPIMSQRNLSYIHKTTWGLYAAGVDHGVVARLLDWAYDEAFRPTGDFFFPEEGPEYKDYQRVYRPLNFCRVAVWIDHPLIRRQQVLDRILQYQHEPSGGVFHYIGDDPAKPEPPPSMGTLNTTFFGQLMLTLDNRERALAVGDWVRRWVEANRQPMAEGKLYTQVTPEGKLVTDFLPNEKISKVVDLVDPKQEFWNVGTAMAYLADLYDAMRKRWWYSHDQAAPYLDAALELLDFELRMPLSTYFWPSKCKVGWGAGELLRVLVENGVGTPDQREKAYQAGERTMVLTFLGNQLASGGWPPMHYPLTNDVPEMAFNYKVLGDHVSVPIHPIKGSKAIFLSSVEITAEFLGEIKGFEEGVAAWLKAEQ